MGFDEAMQKAAAGEHLTLPHWCWLYVSKDARGKLSLYDDDDERQALYRATRMEKRSTDWQLYEHAAKAA